MTCVIWGLSSATTLRDTSVSIVGRSLTSVSGASRYVPTETHQSDTEIILMVITYCLNCCVTYCFLWMVEMCTVFINLRISPVSIFNDLNRLTPRISSGINNVYFVFLKNFSRTDRLLRHRRLCQGRSVAKVENQPCCEPRPYPQEPPPAPPTWSPMHPPPGRLAVWHSTFPVSTIPPETGRATGFLLLGSVLSDATL